MEFYMPIRWIWLSKMDLKRRWFGPAWFRFKSDALVVGLAFGHAVWGVMVVWD